MLFRSLRIFSVKIGYIFDRGGFFSRPSSEFLLHARFSSKLRTRSAQSESGGLTLRIFSVKIGYIFDRRQICVRVGTYYICTQVI